MSFSDVILATEEAAADARKKFAPFVSPNSIMSAGDSIMADGFAANGTAGSPGYVISYDANRGALNLALAYLAGRLTHKGNVAVGGRRTDQWLSSGQPAAVVAAAPTWCALSGPTNDREQGIPLADSKANYLTFIRTLRAAGIKVMLLGLLPESAGSVGTAFTQTKIDYTINWNYWIKTLAAIDPGIVVVDAFRALSDTVTGNWFAFANPNPRSPDGLHPHSLATAVIGRMIYDVLEPLVPYLDPRPLGSIDKPSAGVLNGNIILGAGMHGTAGNNGSDRGGSGTVVSNFGARSSDSLNFAGTVVSSIVASTDADRTPWQRHVVTGASTKLRAQQATITPASGMYTPGETIARPQIELYLDPSAVLTKLVVSLAANVPGGSIESQWAFINPSAPLTSAHGMTKDAKGRCPVLIGRPMLIPANATSVTWYADFEGTADGEGINWRHPALRTTPTF